MTSHSRYKSFKTWSKANNFRKLMKNQISILTRCLPRFNHPWGKEGTLSSKGEWRSKSRWAISCPSWTQIHTQWQEAEVKLVTQASSKFQTQIKLIKLTEKPQFQRLPPTVLLERLNYPQKSWWTPCKISIQNLFFRCKTTQSLNQNNRQWITLQQLLVKLPEPIPHEWTRH